MNTLELVLKARAAATGRAQPRRRLRHAHVEPAPLAIAAMQMAGEPYALWGALVGTSPDTPPRLILAPEPRNRDIAFAALADLANILCGLVDRAAADRVPMERKDSDPWLCCRAAPQLLVANRAVADLLGRLGRRMRPAGLGGGFAVPPAVNLAGAHLGFFAEEARHPGSALVLVATEELSRQAVTGQSALEDAHLGAQLAWWDPAIVEQIQPGTLVGADPTALHGARAAAAIERVPMGVLPDPALDRHGLGPALERFNAARASATDRDTVRRLQGDLAGLLLEALAPTWRALWEAHRRLSAIPAAPGAERRWEHAVQRFTRHVDYLAEGGRVASVHSARRAAMLLADWERAQAALERDEVLEDPLALAAALAAGQAIQGTVEAVDLARTEASATGKSQVKRPVLTLVSPDACPFPAGTQVWWTERPGNVSVEVLSAAARPEGGSRVVLKVTGGMRGALPTEGSRAVFSIYTTGWVPPAPLPAETPWTHVPDPAAEADDAVDLDAAEPRVALLAGVGVGAAR